MNELAEQEGVQRSRTAARPIRPLSRAWSAGSMGFGEHHQASWVTPEYESTTIGVSARKPQLERPIACGGSSKVASGSVAGERGASNASPLPPPHETPEPHLPEQTERVSLELEPSPDSFLQDEPELRKTTGADRNGAALRSQSLQRALDALVQPYAPPQREQRRTRVTETQRAQPASPSIEACGSTRITSEQRIVAQTERPLWNDNTGALRRPVQQLHPRHELFVQMMRDLGAFEGTSSRGNGDTSGEAAALTLSEILNLPPIRTIVDDEARARAIALKLEFCTVVPSLPEWIAETEYNQRVERWLHYRHAQALQSLRTMVAISDQLEPESSESVQEESKRQPIGGEHGNLGGMYVGLLAHKSSRAGSIERTSPPRMRASRSAPALGQLASEDAMLEGRAALRNVVERFTRLATNKNACRAAAEQQGVAPGDTQQGTVAGLEVPRTTQHSGTGVVCSAGASAAPAASSIGALSGSTAPDRSVLPEESSSPTPSAMPATTATDEPGDYKQEPLIRTPADLMDLKRAVLADLLDAAEQARQHGESAFTGVWKGQEREQASAPPSPRMPFIFQITSSGNALERPVRDAGMSAASWSCRSQTSSSFFCYPLLSKWVRFFAANLFRPLPLRKRLAEPEYLSERETPTLHYVSERSSSSRASAARPGSPAPVEGAAARGCVADIDHVVFVDDELTNPWNLLDPVWPHLELVYSLFIEFSLCRIGQVPEGVQLGEELAAKHFNQRFLHALLSLFVSEDPRERDALRTVVHRLYARYAALRPSIRKVMAEVVFARPIAEDDVFRQISWFPHCAHMRTSSALARTTCPAETRSRSERYPQRARCTNLPESAALAADCGLRVQNTEVFLAGSHPAAIWGGLCYNGVSEALDILAAIVAGFSTPLREEHRYYFRRVLLPMHKARGLARYHRELTMCIVFYVSKDVSLGVEAIRTLLRHWPQTSARKQLLFLTEMNDILTACGIALSRSADTARQRTAHPGTIQSSRRRVAFHGRYAMIAERSRQQQQQQQQQQQSAHINLVSLVNQFAVLVPAIFSRLAECICSSQMDVSERAIYMVSNQELIGELVEKYRAQVYPILVPAVYRTSSEHWSQEVRHMATVLAGLLEQLDVDRFREWARAGHMESPSQTSPCHAERESQDLHRMLSYAS
jgi:hypothetical protein